MELRCFTLSFKRQLLFRGDANEGAAKELALKSVTRRKCLNYAGLGRGLRFRIDQLVGFFVEDLPRFGFKDHQAKSANRVATGILEKAQLLNDGRLP